jgi:hypothetical protein
MPFSCTRFLRLTLSARLNRVPPQQKLLSSNLSTPQPSEFASSDLYSCMLSAKASPAHFGLYQAVGGIGR